MKQIFGVVLRSYATQRALTAALMFSSLIVGAALTDQDEYGEILLIIFMAKFLNILNFGATSGFFVSFYGREGMLGTGEESSKIQYCISVITHLLIFTLIGICLSVIYFPQYIYGLIAFVALIPFYAIEPVFRLKRRFYLSLIPDVLLSTSLYITIALVMLTNANVQLIYLGVLVVSSILCLLTIAVGRNVTYYSLRKNIHFIPLRYIHLIRLGMPVYCGSALFMLASGMDRFLMPIHISQNEQATYLFSFQLATGAMIFLTSTNFVNTIDLGQAHFSHEGTKIRFLRRKLWGSACLAALSLIALLAGVVGLDSYFLDGYENLTNITMALGFGLSIFFVAGSLTPVLAYHRKQVPLTLCMGIVAIFVLINNIVAINLGYGILWLSSFTAAMLIIYGLIAISYTFKVVKAQVSE